MGNFVCVSGEGWHYCPLYLPRHVQASVALETAVVFMKAAQGTILEVGAERLKKAAKRTKDQSR